MPTYSIVILVTIIICTTLLTAVLREKSTKTRNAFVLYLIVSLIWSVTVLLYSLEVMGSSRIVAGLIAMSGLLTVGASYHFISIFVLSMIHWTVKAGYTVLFLVLIPLVVLGQIPR